EKWLNSEISNPSSKCYRAVTYPELDQALKEFVLIYQNKTILSDAFLVKKAKHTKILFADTNTNLQDLSDDISQTMNSELDDFSDILEALHPHLTYSMQVEEFLVANLTTNDSEEMDNDSNEISIININTAMASLETVCTFLLQQDNNTNEYIKTARK
ncbi:14735_t:CDS:2, partial [Dentiscutata erythropus]